jgi:hypothetical protein
MTTPETASDLARGALLKFLASTVVARNQGS